MTVCIEKKLALSGRIDEFICELLQLLPGRGVLRYVLDREYAVDGVRLLPGDVTDAIFWEDRPYTLYIWRTRLHGSVFYFNIADNVMLSPDSFAWRDLAIDILVEPGRGPRVLDEDELPQDLPPTLQGYIESAKNLVLTRYRSLIQEAESILSTIGRPDPASTDGHLQ